jgi:hypothetical protein
MSELRQLGDQDPQRQVREAIAEQALERLGWLDDAAEVIGGRGAKFTKEFKAPEVVGDVARDDAPMPNWTPEQAEKIKAVGRRFGYGAEADVSSGLSGGVRIAEGGKAWKIMAEVEAFKAEDNPDTFIFCGSPFRKLGEDEHKFLKEEQEIDLPASATEYDLALVLARRQADGSVADEPVPQTFGYETSPGNLVTSEATGQLVQVGETSGGQSVQLLRIEGELYKEDGQTKERNRPDTARVISFIAEKLTAEGKANDPIVVGTSNTYASRVPDTIRAGLELDPQRPIGIVMYGRGTISELGAPVPKEMPLNHLPGDLRLMHDKLQQLRTAALKI